MCVWVNERVARVHFSRPVAKSKSTSKSKSSNFLPALDMWRRQLERQLELEGNRNGNKASCAFLQLIKIRPRSWLALSALLCSARGPGANFASLFAVCRSTWPAFCDNLFSMLWRLLSTNRKTIKLGCEPTRLPQEQVLHEQTKMLYTISTLVWQRRGIYLKYSMLLNLVR